MTPLSAQEIFDRVARHLLTQGRKSRSGGGDAACKYRGPRGLKCALGCLIPDVLYSKVIENAVIMTSIDGGYERNDVNLALAQLLLDCGIGVERWPLLDDLQILHDHSAVENWRPGLDRIAVRHSLSPSILSTLPATGAGTP